jgi:hypothetical protein
MKLKVLNIMDFREAMAMTNLKERVGGTSKTDRLNERFYYYFTTSPRALALGYYEDDKLISWATLRFARYDNINLWTITSLWANRFNNILSFDKPELGYLMKGCFEIAERRKYWDYFYVIASRLEHVYQRQWLKNPWVKTGRYNLVTYAHIPENTIPESMFLYKLLGEQTKPDAMTVKHRILKEEFRQDYTDVSEIEKDTSPYSIEELQSKPIIPKE